MSTRVLFAAALLAALCAACTHAQKPSTPVSLGPVYAKALEGDVRQALVALDQVPVEALSDAQRSERECLLRTFSERKLEPAKVADPFVAGVVGIYRDYWMRVLLQELSVPQGEAWLFERLRAFLAPRKFASLDDLVDALGPILEQKGFHSIRGVTRPYYELMLWGKETTQSYDVQLPETKVSVKVVFMHDFAVYGWSEFATCGKARTGGWAKDDALYNVADAYDASSETFAVSYLAHEGQHFADYKRFPKLEQPELEYRAKLTELALAKQTAHELVTQFASRTSGGRDAPHNFANRRVVTDLSRALFGSGNPVQGERRWAGIPVEDINATAAALLKADSARLAAAG